MVRRFAVSVLVGVLALVVAPRPASAAHDRVVTGNHYRCMWHCDERAHLFQDTQHPSKPSRPRSLAQTTTQPKSTFCQRAAPDPANPPANPPTLADKILRWLYSAFCTSPTAQPAPVPMPSAGPPPVLPPSGWPVPHAPGRPLPFPDPGRPAAGGPILFPWPHHGGPFWWGHHHWDHDDRWDDDDRWERRKRHHDDDDRWERRKRHHDDDDRWERRKRRDHDDDGWPAHRRHPRGRDF
jgi:hypothetical protein